MSRSPHIVLPELLTQPSLRGTIIVFLDVSVIRDEEEGARVLQVYLHATEACSVAWQVVQSDASEKVDLAIVECLPVEIEACIKTKFR